MGVAIDAGDDRQWHLLSTYAAWSIQVELYGLRGKPHLATLHDCAESVTVNLTTCEAAALGATTAGLAVVEPSDVVRARYKAEKSVRRHGFWETRFQKKTGK